MHIDTPRIARIALPLLAAFGCIGPTEQTLPEEGETLLGAVQISVSTTGDNVDPNGYLVTIDESMSEPVGVNGSVGFGSLAPGSYQVTLSEVDSNCAVEAPGSMRSFTVLSGATTAVAYGVVCT
jgi:hypothetical protein